MANDEGSWLVDGGSVSPSNPVSSVQRSFALYDTTLRDGEQQAGICFSVEQKVRLFRAIEAAGVPFIETGMTAVSPDEEEVVRRLKSQGTQADVYVLSRCMEDDLRLASACGADGVTLEITVNPGLASTVFHWSREAILEKATQHTRRAKDLGLRVNFFGLDATRTDVDWLSEFFTQVVDAGAESVTVADTLGVCSPEGVSSLIGALAAVVSVPIQIHCHDDYGLATANSLAAVAAGATVVQATMNALGERAGNASLAEVAVAATFLHGWDPKVDLMQLRDLAAVVAQEANIPLAPNAPVVGPTLFDIESGIAAAFYTAIADEDLRLFYPYVPDRIGGHPRVVMGKGSGVANIRYALRQLGHRDIDEQTERALVSRVKSAGGSLRRCLTESEAKGIFDEVISQESTVAI